MFAQKCENTAQPKKGDVWCALLGQFVRLPRNAVMHSKSVAKTQDRVIHRLIVENQQIAPSAKHYSLQRRSSSASLRIGMESFSALASLLPAASPATK